MTTSLAVFTALGLLAAEEPRAAIDAEVHRPVEFSLTSDRDRKDPFNEVEVDLRVTTPSGRELLVPAFWAGGKAWRVRYASGEPGPHRFRSQCSDPTDAGLHGKEWTLEVGPGSGKNLLLRRGPPRVSADRQHFEHPDGTPFFWLADTWWMGLCRRLSFEDFQTLAADRAEKGFTVVQIVAGLYPDMPAFDPRGAGDGGFPWTEGYARVNPGYFDAADRRIAHLVDSGIVPCIVGAWGYHLPWLGVERMKQHWRYLVARWGAWPVFWCVAGEGAMPWYLSERKEADRAFQRKGWTEVAAYLRKIDPFGRPVSIHPTDTARGQVEDVSVLDFDMLQTGHGDRSSIPGTIRAVRASRAAAPAMPTINSEVCYEGILGTCHAEVQRFMAWSCLLSGAAGHTYGANGIWQVNRPGEPYGKSPHGGNWGETPWREAMALPGSGQVALARRVLGRFPWHRFRPHQEWAAWEMERPVRWGSWIWFPEGDPARDAPVAPRWFRAAFEVPAGAAIDSAVLHLAADDRFTAWMNGRRLGSHADWSNPVALPAAEGLRPGRNVLALRAENAAAPVKENPAGLIASLEVRLAGGEVIHVLSDGTWRARDREETGWMESAFDDAAWPRAAVVAPHGGGPWGRIGSRDEFIVPYAAGIPGQVRVVYLPQPRRAVLRGLETGIRWRGIVIDPVAGQETDLGEIEPRADGSWTPPAPTGGSPDRVLILQAR